MKKLILLSACASLAIPAMAQSVDEHISAGEKALLDYRLQEAASHFADARSKGKKEIPEKLLKLEQQLNKTENFINRVENIVILDSLAVPKGEFFKSYILPAASGTLGDHSSLPYPIENVNYVFTNEEQDYKMWAQPDSLGHRVLVESNLLTDGSWSAPAKLPEILYNGGNAIFPFMMSDGVTLYFAANGEDSLGGYDIFVASRDPGNNDYRQPQNLGMPYNSPYDDYMMAIDEVNGVGWWATDRNRLGDNITIYLFKVNDLRTNYNPDETPDLAARARALYFKDTWGEEDYSELLEQVMTITAEEGPAKGDFYLPVKGGGAYTYYSDFKSQGAASMMQKYVAQYDRFKRKEGLLKELRHSYAKNPSPSLKANIKTKEAEIENERAVLKTMLSNVYRAEFK